MRHYFNVANVKQPPGAHVYISPRLHPLLTCMFCHMCVSRICIRNRKWGRLSCIRPHQLMKMDSPWKDFPVQAWTEYWPTWYGKFCKNKKRAARIDSFLVSSSASNNLVKFYVDEAQTRTTFFYMSVHITIPIRSTRPQFTLNTDLKLGKGPDSEFHEDFNSWTESVECKLVYVVVCV